MAFPAAPARRAAAVVATMILGVLTPVVTDGFTTTASAAGSCYNVQKPVPATIDSDARYEIQRAVACLVNEERSAWGLPEVTASAMLDSAAALHDDWMGSTHTFSHEETGPGSHATPGDRATAAGYQWSYVSENIAAGQTTPYEVVDAWLHSPGHCRNLMSPDVADTGLAISNQTVSVGGQQVKPIWTQMFGRWISGSSPSDDRSAADACSAGQAFPARSEAFMSGTFTITESDFEGRLVDGPDETATVDPDDTVAMEREFTLTNRTGSTLRNPGFQTQITDRPVEQDFLDTVNTTCFADDPGTSGYTLVETGCSTTGSGAGYIAATVPPGESVKLRISLYNGPSSEEHPGEKTGWRVTFTGRYTDLGELIPADVQPSYSQTWTWKRSHTGVGFGLRSAADGKPYEPDVVIGTDGTGTWTVPVVNGGDDAYPKKLTLFVDAARGAKVLSASLPGASCRAGTSFESNHRPGLRCDLPARFLAGRSTRNLVVRAKAATTAKGSPDRGAIGVQMGDPDVNEAFGTDASISGWVIDALPASYAGVKSGRVDRFTDNVDDQSRATGFCRTDDDCDLNSNGIPDHEETAKKRSTVTVKAKGGKKQARFSVTVKVGSSPATGTVTVQLAGRTLKKATLRGGKASFTVTRQKKGSRTYTVRYAGNTRTKASSATVRLKIT